MAKLKVMTILGTRPEIIRLSAVIPCADRYFRHVLVHTGQNYDDRLNKVFFDELGLRAPVVVHEHHSLREAADHMVAENIGRLIVVGAQAPDAAPSRATVAKVLMRDMGLSFPARAII